LLYTVFQKEVDQNIPTKHKLEHSCFSQCMHINHICHDFVCCFDSKTKNGRILFEYISHFYFYFDMSCIQTSCTKIDHILVMWFMVIKIYYNSSLMVLKFNCCHLKYKKIICASTLYKDLEFSVLKAFLFWLVNVEIMSKIIAFDRKINYWKILRLNIKSCHKWL
jgi:hypothetical protein